MTTRGHSNPAGPACKSVFRDKLPHASATRDVRENLIPAHPVPVSGRLTTFAGHPIRTPELLPGPCASLVVSRRERHSGRASVCFCTWCGGRLHHENGVTRTLRTRRRLTPTVIPGS